MASTVKISSKGQITLPKELREKHHPGEGEEAMVVDTEAGILIRPRPKRSLYRLFKGRVDSAGVEKAIRQLRHGSNA
ncbi:MAG: AbrB/MazE/SpoVT family DNA-binding domain-containing protein [Euryarchaeota archaeon]|nr:AbrB/MazE/SpoVT family DNA-binding domain-containing protein [Euryarchaeota archaeon]